MRKKSFFITFEGAEGTGKSTQIKRTADYLKRKGYRVLILREPGGTRVSEAIRKVILNKQFREMRPECELLLYLAARAQVVREKILPALKKGIVVICDRFEDSTLVYQGFGRGISIPFIKSLSSFVRHAVKPRLTFLLDLQSRVGLKRSGKDDRMESQTLSFHQKVRRGFLQLAKRDPKRFVIIDGRLSRETIARKVKEHLDRVFS